MVSVNLWAKIKGKIKHLVKQKIQRNSKTKIKNRLCTQKIKAGRFVKVQNEHLDWSTKIHERTEYEDRQNQLKFLLLNS